LYIKSVVNVIRHNWFNFSSINNVVFHVVTLLVGVRRLRLLICC